jgi:RNA polymerase sigma-70 factor, ECF subfamily
VSEDREGRWRGFLEEIGRGDSEALAKLYRETVPILYGTALRILNHQADAEEVVLEVYEQVWRTASGYDPSRSRVLWWLSMLLRSRALDRLRASTRRASIEEPVLDGADFTSPEPAPDVSAAESQRRVLVHDALKDLPPDQRQAVELAFFSELSHSEIAEKLEIPLGTIKTRIRTALRRLRDSLGDVESFVSDRFDDDDGDRMEQTA